MSLPPLITLRTQAYLSHAGLRLSLSFPSFPRCSGVSLQSLQSISLAWLGFSPYFLDVPVRILTDVMDIAGVLLTRVQTVLAIILLWNPSSGCPSTMLGPSHPSSLPLLVSRSPSCKTTSLIS